MKLLYNGLNLYKAAGVQFIPGVNTVEDDVWAKAKQHPLVATRVENGVIQEIKADKEDEGSGDQNLKGHTEKAALKLVESTIDPELLKAWQAAESRDKVKAAIGAQLEKIDPTKKDEESK